MTLRREALVAAALGLVLSSGCDAYPPGGADETSSSGHTNGVEEPRHDPGSSESGGEDAEVEAIANLRAQLHYAGECLDLRKWGASDEALVIIDIPPSNLAQPGEETAEHTYDLAADTQVAMRAFVGVPDASKHVCEDEPSSGTRFNAVSGTLAVTYHVVDKGCLFTCERLFVEASDVVFERESDGATVMVEKLFVPGWTDPDAE